MQQVKKCTSLFIFLSDFVELNPFYLQFCHWPVCPLCSPWQWASPPAAAPPAAPAASGWRTSAGDLRRSSDGNQHRKWDGLNTELWDHWSNHVSVFTALRSRKFVSIKRKREASCSNISAPFCSQRSNLWLAGDCKNILLNTQLTGWTIRVNLITEQVSWVQIKLQLMKIFYFVIENIWNLKELNFF